MLRLLGAHICGSLKVQHGLALLLLILRLVLHLQRGTDAGQTPSMVMSTCNTHTLQIHIHRCGVLHYPQGNPKCHLLWQMWSWNISFFFFYVAYWYSVVHCDVIDTSQYQEQLFCNTSLDIVDEQFELTATCRAGMCCHSTGNKGSGPYGSTAILAWFSGCIWLPTRGENTLYSQNGIWHKILYR